MSMFNRPDRPDGTPAETTAVVTPVTGAVAPKPVTAQPATVTPPRPANSPGGVSVISKALKITGQLESTEDIRIDGEVEGDVRGVSVTVGSGAKVKGTVYGDAVELSGTIEGKIEAEKVVLTSSAHMSGDVLHKDIRIESGAYIDGHLRPGYVKGENRGSRPVVLQAKG